MKTKRFLGGGESLAQSALDAQGVCRTPARRSYGLDVLAIAMAAVATSMPSSGNTLLTASQFAMLAEAGQINVCRQHPGLAESAAAATQKNNLPLRRETNNVQEQN